jgi:hypothetical protein
MPVQRTPSNVHVQKRGLRAISWDAMLALRTLTGCVRAMIAVKAENGHVQLTFPTEGMSPDEINDFVGWLRVESVARRSNLTKEAATQLSEDIQTGWWQANEARVGQSGTK